MDGLMAEKYWKNLEKNPKTGKLEEAPQKAPPKGKHPNSLQRQKNMDDLVVRKPKAEPRFGDSHNKNFTDK
jgi:hypothetical protein